MEEERQYSIKERLNAGYQAYIESKLGKQFQLPHFTYRLSANACSAYNQLCDDFDLGVAIAKDGLWLGYHFDLLGFPTKAVKMHRKGKSATFETIDDLTREDVEGKRILLFDNDVVTGRTTKKMVKELQKHNPAKIGLLLLWEYTGLSIKNFKKWSHYFPDDVSLYSHYSSMEFTEEGMKGTLKKNGKEISKTNNELTFLNCRINVPSEIDSTHTLAKDFDTYEEIPRDLERQDWELYEKQCEDLVLAYLERFAEILGI